MSQSSSNFEYNAPTDFRIAQLPDNLPPELQNAFVQLYSAVQQIIFTFIINCGVGPRNSNQWNQLAASAVTLLSGNLNRLYIQAAENIPYGAAVNLYNSSGTLMARNANATDGTKVCQGFCSLSTGIAEGTTGEVQIVSGVVQIGGLTPGAPYYLSTVNGLISTSPPASSGNVVQYLGFAVDDTNFAFNVGAWYVHA